MTELANYVQYVNESFYFSGLFKLLTTGQLMKCIFKLCGVLLMKYCEFYIRYIILKKPPYARVYFAVVDRECIYYINAKKSCGLSTYLVRAPGPTSGSCSLKDGAIKLRMLGKHIC